MYTNMIDYGGYPSKVKIGEDTYILLTARTLEEISVNNDGSPQDTEQVLVTRFLVKPEFARDYFGDTTITFEDLPINIPKNPLHFMGSVKGSIENIDDVVDLKKFMKENNTKDSYLETVNTYKNQHKNGHVPIKSSFKDKVIIWGTELTNKYIRK